MPQVVACPRCSVAVAVASSAVARLRCPVCQQEFAPLDAPAEPLSTPARREPAAPTSASVQASSSAHSAPRAAPAVANTRAAVQPRGSSGGWLSNLVGVLGGGFLGLVAGYYLLNFFGGPRYDFLGIPLPRVAHTQPGWTDPHASAATAPEATSPPDALASPTPVVAIDPAEPGEFQTAAPPVTVEAPGPGPAEAVPPAEAVELAALETPVTPLTPGPRQARRYTTDDLSEALTAAHAALGCPNCNSTGFVTRVMIGGIRLVNGQSIEEQAERHFPCEVCQGRPSFRLTQEVYLQLCHLAEVATFVAIEPDDKSIWSHKQAIRQVLLDAAGNQDRASAMGRLAGHWLGNRQRGGQGIVLAGTVRDVGRQGPFYLTKVVLFGRPKEITVVSAARSPFQPRERVLVAGSIIDEPAANLVGYEGSQSQVIWGGLPLRLPDDAL